MNISPENQLKIFVITTGDSERVSRIKQYLKEIDFEFVYSDSYEDLLELERKYKKYSHKFRQKAIMAGEIGCFKTHSKAWEKTVELSKPSIIIEDNVEFVDDISKLTSQDTLEYIQTYGLVNFTSFSYLLDPTKPFKVSDVKEKKPFPTVCYGVTPMRAYDLLKHMRKTPYSLPIDKWLSIPKLSGCYGYISPLVFAKRQEDLKSIANKRKGKKTINPINFLYRAVNKLKYKY